MDPLKLLEDELYSIDIGRCISALARVDAIALALGTQRSANELVPLLLRFTDCSTLNQDEVDSNARQTTDNNESSARANKHGALGVNTDRVIADEAIAMVGEHCGSLGAPGIDVPTSILVPLFESLLSRDETCVRQSAVKGTTTLISHTSSAELVDTMLPMLERLSNHDWFAARCSAAQILTVLYEKITSDDQARSKLLTLMASLCKDETPMVRKSAFIELARLCAAAGATRVRAELAQCLRLLCEDEQDTVRIFIVDCSISIATVVDESNFKEIALPLIEEASADTSWRVRRHLARKFDLLMKAVNRDIVITSLMPLLLGLLRDTESEVRESIIKKLLSAATIIGCEETTKTIAPMLSNITTDSAETSRVALSECIVELSPFIEESVVKKTVLPIAIGMLQDEIPEVRLNVLEKVHNIGKVVGMPLLVTSIQPMIKQMAIDQRWRIRSGVFDKIAEFTKDAGTSVYEKNYHELLFRGLSDTVYEVRKICAAQVGLIVSNFGGEWAKNVLIPDALKMFDISNNYLHRMVPLQIIAGCAIHFDQTYVGSTLLPVVLNGCKDNIANVRICAVRTMEIILPAIESSDQQEKVKPVLLKMKEDPDLDVKFYSTQTLALIE